MNHKSPIFLIFASLPLLFGGSAAFARANADTAKETATAKTTSHMMTDSHFAKLAADGGLYEVKLGQLAEDKGASQTVRDFGKRMVTDHTRIDQALKAAASSDKIMLPSQVNAKDDAVYDRLSKLSGTAFDRAYAQDMVQDHTADIAVFEREARNGKDSSIKNFAAVTLPTLRDHLKEARGMLSNVSAAKQVLPKKQQS